MFKFLKAARNLVNQGMSKEAIEQFARNEFGEINELFQKQIDNLFKQKQGIENIKIKDEVFDDTIVKLPIDDTGAPFNPKDPMKQYGKPKKSKKMTDVEEAIDNASPGFAGDIKYDAQLVADDLAERMGKTFDDLSQKEQIDLYDQAYKSLSKQRFKNRPASEDRALEDFVDDAGGVNPDDPRGIDDFIPDPEDMAQGGIAGYAVGNQVMPAVDARMNLDYNTLVNQNQAQRATQAQNRNPFKNIGFLDTQRHFDNNQLLKNAVSRGELSSADYNRLGGFDVAQTMGGGNPVLGGIGNLIGSTAYNAYQSIKDGQPILEGIKDIGRNVQGGTGLISDDLKAQYESIINSADKEKQAATPTPDAGAPAGGINIGGTTFYENAQGRGPGTYDTFYDGAFTAADSAYEMEKDIAKRKANQKPTMADVAGPSEVERFKKAYDETMYGMPSEEVNWYGTGRPNYEKMLAQYKNWSGYYGDGSPYFSDPEQSSKFESLFGKSSGYNLASGGRAGYYTGGMVDVEPNLSDIGHGSDALMARTRLVSPDGQATTSTGLNYLLAEDNDNIRVPFSKGKIVDLARRGFLKTMGAAGAGIAALKTGLLGIGGKKATKEVAKEIITTPAAAGKPEWFDALVTRVIREGDDVTKTMATKDRQNVYIKKIDDETEVVVTQDLDEGVTRIDIDDSTRNVTGFDDPPTVSLQVTDEIVEEGGARIKPEFKATENDYRNYATDPDGGYDTEFVENTVEEVKDLTSDLTKVKSFATKKGPTMEEIVISKQKRDNVKYANENPSAYAADRGPDYDPSDYIDDMADDYASGGIARMIGGIMDIETILSMYEDDYTPAIGPRAMVGEITNEQTQFGRPIYKTPSGEKVSEKSMTLFFNGNWMNVPSIHGGKSFNENELRRMIKQGNIEPTSVHKSKADAEAAAKDRSDSMVQELRPMAQGGRIPFDNGGDTSPVKTEEYKYPRSNRFGTVYSKTPGTNQYGALTRSLEEVQAIIDNAPKIQKKNKVVEMTEKDLTGQSKYNNVSKKVGPAKIFVSRKELEKYEGKLNFKTSGKPILEDASKKNKVRQARDLARSNPTIFRKMSGKEGYQLAHLSLDELDSLKNLGYLPADINIKQYFPFEKKIVAISKDIYDIQKDKKLSIQEKRNKIAELQKKDRELRKQFPEYAKTKARLNVRATGLDSSGLMIKEKLPDPSIAIAPTEAGTTLKYIKTGSQKDAEVVKIAKENFLKKLENKKFGRVADVVVKASQEGGFGEAVQTICKRRKAKKGGRMFLSTGSGCPAAKDDPKGFLKSVSENPKLAKFLKSAPGKKAMTMAARVTGNVLNPTTLIGGEVAFVLGDGLNNFASGLPLDESFDRAFVFGDFGQFEKNLINQAKELGYDDNQLNLLQQTININKLNNKRKKLEFGLDKDKSDMSGLTSDATMGFEDRLVNTNKNLDDSVGNYLNTLDNMGFDSNKAADQATGFTYLDNVFKKRTQDQLVKDFEDRKRQVDPTKTPFGDFISPVFDLGSYTQPLKFAADIVNPFTKDVPFLSERQQEAKKLREMSEEKLDAYNKARGFTIEDIQQGTSPQIRETMDYLGTDVTGQGFGTTSLAEGGITTLRSKYEYKK